MSKLPQFVLLAHRNTLLTSNKDNNGVNDASHDGDRERRLTAAHSILAGAVAPRQDAQ